MRDARFQAEAQREIDQRGECEAAHDDLHQAEAENVLAQPPQPVRVQLEPDEEQQERDADFRHRHDRIGLADQPQHLRADDRSADNIAEGRAEPELAEYGDEDQRRAEHERAVHEQVACGDLGRGFRGRRAHPRSLFNRREQCLEGQQDGSMARTARPRGGKRLKARPLAGIVASAGKPAFQLERPRADVVLAPPHCSCREQAGAGLAEGAGVHLLRDRRRCGHPRRAGPAAGPCFRRSENAAPTSRRRAPARGARAAKPPAAGSRSCRAARSFLRQVVPEALSSNTMPSAFSSSRMRSAVAKSRLFFASARSAMRASMSASASPPEPFAEELCSD